MVQVALLPETSLCLSGRTISTLTPFKQYLAMPVQLPLSEQAGLMLAASLCLAQDLTLLVLPKVHVGAEQDTCMKVI